MKSKILGLLAVGLLAGPISAQAVPVTEEFKVTLNWDSGTYFAGHVFTITATYDDAGTAMTIWNDGLNGVAEFGAGDDSVAVLATTTPGFTLFSDAQISIAGLDQFPPGATPYDFWAQNMRQYFVDDNGAWYLQLYADSFSLYLTSAGTFRIYDYFINTEQFLSANYVDAYGSAFSVSRRIVPPPTPAPEPGTLALLGLGFAGLGLRRRRKTN